MGNRPSAGGSNVRFSTSRTKTLRLRSGQALSVGTPACGPVSNGTLRPAVHEVQQGAHQHYGFGFSIPLRSTEKPSGNVNQCGSGSAVLTLVAVNCCLPDCGLSNSEIRLIPSCGEYQNSRMVIIGWSFPNTPGFTVVVSLKPVVSNPSISLLPRSSTFREPCPFGRGPDTPIAGWYVVAADLRYGSVKHVLEATSQL